MAKEKISSRALTEKLREIMAEIHTTDLKDGEMVMKTNCERLAEILADRALGWDEEVEIADKKVPGGVKRKQVKHPPEKWAIVMVYERMEGKTPTAVADETSGIKVADKVSELAVDAINRLTEEETTDGDS